MRFAFHRRITVCLILFLCCGIGAFPGWLPAVTGLATPLRYYSPTFFDRTAAATFGGVTARDASVRRRMIEARRSHPPSADGYALQLFGIVGWSSWHFLRSIPHETLVICGDDDPLVPVANAHLLAERIPNATLEIVEGAGHLFLWDDAENLGRRIGRFINRSSRSRRRARNDSNVSNVSNGSNALQR